MLETKGLTGAETLLRVLASMGVERIFASPGSEWSPVWEYLAKAKAKSEGAPLYLSSRHEETAVGMASGYAKASGKLPAVMIHTTVGALHGAMAMRGALHEQVPMVILAGESTAFGETQGPDPGGQWLHNLADVGGPVRLVEHCAKWSMCLNNIVTFPAMIQRACQIAMAAPRGPVFLSLPMEFLFDKMTSNAPASSAIPLRPSADLKGIRELADLLTKAKNPIVVSEEAGRTISAAKHLVEIAELLGAPVIETRSSRFINFPRGHSLHGGFDPSEYLEEADLVFLVGAVAPWHPASAGPGANTKVAVLDENPIRTQLPYWGYRTDLCLSGEIGTSLEFLLEHLRRQVSSGDPSLQDRITRWRARHERRKKTWREEALAQKEKKPIDTRWAVDELNQVLPPDAMVIEETITHRLSIMRYIDRICLGSFFNGHTGGLGTGLGTALGVKCAAPNRPVIAVIGDGSFNYNPVLAAFGFMQEYATPILIILFNNQGYLSMKSGLPKYYPEGWAMRTKTFYGTSITPSPDYATIARAFNCYGETVEEPAQVRPAIERGLKAIASGQGALIDIRLEPVN
ncbi:MAG: thiamine pyrophosphate-binding protein [Candidatus Binatia bacterium]